VPTGVTLDRSASSCAVVVVVRCGAEQGRWLEDR
jgi:hypothetical protein